MLTVNIIFFDCPEIHVLTMIIKVAIAMSLSSSVMQNKTVLPSNSSIYLASQIYGVDANFMGNVCAATRSLCYY